MKIPDHLEGKVKGLLALPVIFLIIYMISKERPFSCDEYAKDFKNDYECHLVLSEIEPGNSGISSFYGIDIKNNQKVEVDDGSKYILNNIEKFKIGDTVIKNKGEYTITIKRKNKTILIPFLCGKVYTDTLKRH